MELKLAILVLLVAAVTAPPPNSGTGNGRPGQQGQNGQQGQSGGRRPDRDDVLDFLMGVQEICQGEEVAELPPSTFCTNVATNAKVTAACAALQPAIDAGTIENPGRCQTPDENGNPSPNFDRIEDGLERLQAALEEICPASPTKRQTEPICDMITSAIEAIEALEAGYEAVETRCTADPVANEDTDVCEALGFIEEPETSKRATRKMVENLLRKLLAKKK